MAVERTLSIIKPDAVAKNVIGQIYARFEGAGLKIIAGAPIINGMACLFAHAEMMVNLSRRTALRTSRAGALARPDKALARHIQSIAGAQLLKS